MIDTEHYRRVEDGPEVRRLAQQHVLASTSTSACAAPTAAIRVCDRLRPVLPMLLAICANSPYIDRRDSGLHSGAHADVHQVVPALRRSRTRSAPGRAWADYVDLLVRTGSIVEFTQLWWSVRPHHDFGTVEVRICDAQTTAAEADGARRLIVACVPPGRCARSTRATRRRDLPGRLIEENMWRAIRYGLDGRLLDLEAERVEEFPAARGARAPARLDRAPTSCLPELNGAQRQRRLIDAGATPAEVYAECVRETQATYFEETVR